MYSRVQYIPFNRSLKLNEICHKSVFLTGQSRIFVGFSTLPAQEVSTHISVKNIYIALWWIALKCRFVPKLARASTKIKN